MTDVALNHPEVVRPRHRLLRVLLCLVVVSGFIAWGISRIGDGLHDLGDGLGRAIVESGAFDAAQVSNLAASEGVTPGFVSMARIQQSLPDERWLPGTVAAASGKNEVSLLATDDHVITATQEYSGGCFFGLAVGSAGDPVVAADGLPGPGVYWNFGDVTCAAGQAPTSNWSKVSKSDLFDAGIAVPPGSGQSTVTS